MWARIVDETAPHALGITDRTGNPPTGRTQIRRGILVAQIALRAEEVWPTVQTLFYRHSVTSQLSRMGLPEPPVRTVWSKRLMVKLMAVPFGVSKEAMQWRLYGFGLVRGARVRMGKLRGFELRLRSGEARSCSTAR